MLPRREPVIVAVNKVDSLATRRSCCRGSRRLPRGAISRAIVPVSAERGRSCRRSAEIASAARITAAVRAKTTLTDRDERFLAAEFIREKIFRLLGDEVPYSTTVGIERFEQEGKLRRIAAVVYVEKATQRAILLGEGGSTIKAIATQARFDMQTLFGGTVFLEIWVRVKRGWAESDASLTRMGY
jgi:GTP-binding protein Era